MKRTLQIIFPLLLATAILCFLYYDFPFSVAKQTLSHNIQWHWIGLGMLCGAGAQVMRAVRWKSLLLPIGERCRMHNLVGAIFMSYALSLIIPRIGEISRCATIKQSDGVSFTRSLGTVFIERIADTVVLLLIILCVACWHCDLLTRFFHPATTLNPQSQTEGSPIALLAIIVGIGIVAAIVIMAKRIELKQKINIHWQRFKQGFMAIRQVRSRGLFIAQTFFICALNLCSLWLMFYAFSFTAHLGVSTGLLAFCGIAFAMVIPTPNGAGAWHYVVQTALVIYGVDAISAGSFALIVHGIHVLTIVLLGLIGLCIVNRPKKTLPTNQTTP